MARLTIETMADRLQRAWESLRAERNRLLAATDWTQMPDVPLTQAERDAWKAYRQALRDLPASLTDDDVLSGNIPWPQPPQ